MHAATDMLMLVRSGFYVHVNRSGRIQNMCVLSLILFLFVPRQEHLILFTVVFILTVKGSLVSALLLRPG